MKKEFKKELKGVLSAIAVIFMFLGSFLFIIDYQNKKAQERSVQEIQLREKLWNYLQAQIEVIPMGSDIKEVEDALSMRNKEIDGRRKKGDLVRTETEQGELVVHHYTYAFKDLNNVTVKVTIRDSRMSGIQLLTK